MEIINCNTYNKILVQVKRDDTLQSIAQNYNVKLDNIIRNNPSIELYEGEVVKIVRTAFKTHIVKPMQTLDLIAKEYGTTAENLVKINNLKSARLFVGQMLRLD